MSCIERVEIEQFVKGKLAPEKLLAVDSHIRECADCKKLAASLSSRVDLAAAVTGAADCPEYEELSAYLDEKLDAARAAAIKNHANLCELCAGDLDRIQELRSHAALREKITVKPGASRVSQRRGFFFYWRQALAVTSLAGLVAVGFMLSNFDNVATKSHKRPVVAVNPGISSPVKPVTPQNPTKPQPEKIAAKPESAPTKAPVKDTKPAPVVVASVLRDGKYSVVRQGGNLTLAKADGSSVRSSLEAKLAARIDEKLRTGKIKLPEPVQMAMAVPVRGGDDSYEPRPSAPKPVAPVGSQTGRPRIVMSASPTFNWGPVDLANAYRVRVYDESGNMVGEQMTKNTHLTFSKPLARGKVYTWRVGVRFGEEDSWTQSGSIPFYVLSAQDFGAINSVRTRLPGSHLALGAAYESAGLYDEAANEYRMLRRENPNSKLAKDLLYGVARH